MTDMLIAVVDFVVTSLKYLRALQADFLVLVGLCFPNTGLGSY